MKVTEKEQLESEARILAGVVRLTDILGELTQTVKTLIDIVGDIEERVHELEPKQN